MFSKNIVILCALVGIVFAAIGCAANHKSLDESIKQLEEHVRQLHEIEKKADAPGLQLTIALAENTLKKWKMDRDRAGRKRRSTMFTPPPQSPQNEVIDEEDYFA